MDCVIRFMPDGREIEVPEGTPLLDAARRPGLPVASACGGDGACGRCGMKVLAGAEALDPEGEIERTAKRRNRVDDELRLACLVPLRGHLTVTASYW